MPIVVPDIGIPVTFVSMLLQSEALGLHNQLQLTSSQLFDVKAENSRLKNHVTELENARSVPNLAVSRSDLLEMESKFNEEKRLLKMELMSEKTSHQETKKLLKEEHDLREQAEQKEKEANRHQALGNYSKAAHMEIFFAHFSNLERSLEVFPSLWWKWSSDFELIMKLPPSLKVI